MSRPHLPSLFLPLGSIALLFLTGCETAAPVARSEKTAEVHQAVESTPALQFRERMKQLRTGMSKTEVIALAGDPTRGEDASADEAGLERWIYELPHRPKFRTIAADVEEVPFVDPITGEATTILEAITEEEKFQLIERFTLGFDNEGILADLDYVAERRRT